MTSRPRLHSVPAGDVAKPTAKRATPGRPSAAAKKSTPRKPRTPPKPKSIVDAARKGTDRELLIAMRDRIAEDLDSRSTSARDLAALSKRLMELHREIKALEARDQEEGKGNGGAVLDEPFDASAV